MKILALGIVSLFTLTLSAEEAATKEECFPIQYNTRACQELEQKVNYEIKELCRNAADQGIPAEDLKAQLLPHIQDPNYRENVKENARRGIEFQKKLNANARKSQGPN